MPFERLGTIQSQKKGLKLVWWGIKKEAKQKIRDKEKNYKTCQILLKIKVSAFIVCSVHILKHIYEPHSVAVSRSSLNKGIKVKYCQRVCKKRGKEC